MEVKIASTNENPLLKRKEIHFHVTHDSAATPSRPIIRKAVADALKANVDFVFIRKFETKPGMHTADGIANLYDSAEDAKRVEPAYIVKRNIPPPPEQKEGEKKE